MANSKNSPTPGEIESADAAPSGDAAPVIAVNGDSPDTTEATAPAVNTAAEDIPKMSEMEGIRYVGAADSRILTVEDFESLGVDNAKMNLEWNASNDKFVSKSDFNAATRDAILSLPDFVVA